VMAQLQPRRRPAPQWRTVAASLAASFAVVVPVGLAVGPDGITAYGVVVAAAIVAVSTLLYLGVLAAGRWPVAPPWNVRLQALSTAFAAAVAVPVQLWWVGGL
jgi:hypothetical protein